MNNELYLSNLISYPFLLFKKTETESLEKRIAALEIGSQFEATQDAIRKREAEFLETLRGIKATMAAEAGGPAASSAEVESLKSENEKLKQTIEKQQYRIQHLLSGMEKMMKRENSEPITFHTFPHKTQVDTYMIFT